MMFPKAVYKNPKFCAAQKQLDRVVFCWETNRVKLALRTICHEHSY